MGWWNIRDQSGQIDWEHKSSSEQLIGDGPADIMDHALDRICEQYEDSWGRQPKQEELSALLNFCSGRFYKEKN